MNRYICIHGHFYQPPRENPWLETIELQDSAYPYHDWNTRITAECYAPTAKSRILDDRERIVRMVNNYSRISFNFGPTLLAWMEKNTRDVYEAIITADRESRELFSGHGSALAQGYNHIILPLANTRDKTTQAVWGIEDFKSRFSRDPEGMWLPETAVDLESLELMAGLGIRFTVLSPFQAVRVKPMGKTAWQDVSEGKIDSTMPYTLHLPSGRTIAVFFYNGDISRAVAFEKLLSSGDIFSRRLVGGFSDAGERPRLVHIATDGESYGHHHRFGDMALAYALDVIESKQLAQLTNYGEYLEKFPPTHEVEILEDTSWSCAHGIERWRSDCGCRTGSNPTWHQEWREPLRRALDRLRDEITPHFEDTGRGIFRDPWEARNHYIGVIGGRTGEGVDQFFGAHTVRRPEPQERVRALKLMELQRHAMLMYTSCGWFFDDLAGIETVQILQYAGRAIQLAGDLFGRDFEAGFLEILEQARSNDPKKGDGRQIYEQMVRPAVVDLKKVCAYDAIACLFNHFSEKGAVGPYETVQEDSRSLEAGSAKLVLGKGHITSGITEEMATHTFAVLHLGDHNLNCGVGLYEGEEKFQSMSSEIPEAFERADFPETLRLIDRHFEKDIYTLKSLYRDEQRRILNLILQSTLEGTEAVYRNIYEKNAPIMLFLKDSQSPPPGILLTAAELVINADLRLAFKGDIPDRRHIENLLKRADTLGLSLELDALEYAFRKNVEKLAKAVHAGPGDLALLKNLDDTLNLLKILPFQTNLWAVQNVCYDLLGAVYPDFQKEAEGGDENARKWVSHFVSCGEKLSVRL
ncbi:MAG: DUF3536 domain-containing protein [Pseudomonadota bacterium]